MRRLLLVLLIFMIVAPAAAEDRIVPKLGVLEDPGGRLDLAGARREAAAGRFSATPSRGLDAGFSPSAYWLRFDLNAGALAGGRGLLAVGTPVIDFIDVYVVLANGQVSHHRGGDIRAFRERAIANPQPVFPIDPRAREVYVRIASESAIRALPVLWREVAFLRADAREQAFLGIYFGIIAALLLYNLCLYTAVRHRSYLYYVCYLGAVLLLQAKLYGHADQYLWPNFPAAANPGTVAAIALLLIAGCQFARSYLETKFRSPRADRALAGVQIGAAAIALSVFAVGYGVAIKAMMGWVLVTIAVLVTAMVLGLRQGYRPARFLLYAFATLAVGSIVYIARQNGLIPSSLVADHALDVAIVAEAVLLSFALAYRINVATADKQRAEAEVLILQRRFSRGLIDGQEEDRRRIAGELHDSIGQNLLVIGNRLKRMIAGKSEIPVASELKEISELTRASVDEVRAIAHDLRPHELDRLGFSGALRTMVDAAFRDSGIACDAELAEIDGVLPPEAQIHLYRVAQEALNNILKHSGANRALVRLAKDDADIRLLIEDNGRGTAWNGAEAPDDGFGLTAMRERVEMIGGSFHLTGDPKAGTVLSVTVPAGPSR